MAAKKSAQAAGIAIAATPLPFPPFPLPPLWVASGARLLPIGPTWVEAAATTELVALWYALLAAPVSAWELRRIPSMMWTTPLLVMISEATINAELLPDAT